MIFVLCDGAVTVGAALMGGARTVGFAQSTNLKRRAVGEKVS